METDCEECKKSEEKISPESSALIILVLAPLMVLLCGFVGMIISTENHEDYLKQHGCKLYSDTLTGHQVYCGKACTHPEHMIVYDCKEGKKFELN